MQRVTSLISLAVGLALSGCAVAPPVGPSVAAYPPKGKSLAEFQQDDGGCRQYAAAQIGLSPAEAAQQSAVNSAAIGTVLGATAGVALGAAAGNPAAGAAIGAGTGLLFGSAAGANAATVSGAGFQRRYDIAYTQCMTSKGDMVPMMAYGGAPPMAAYPAYPVYPAYPPGYYPYPAYVQYGWGWRRWR